MFTTKPNESGTETPKEETEAQEQPPEEEYPEGACTDPRSEKRFVLGAIAACLGFELFLFFPTAAGEDSNQPE